MPFPDAGLAPAPAGRAAYYRWLFFAAGPLEAAVVNKALGVEVSDDQIRMVGYGTYDTVLDTLQNAIPADGYIAGERFTAADVYLGSHIGWGLQFGSTRSETGICRVFRAGERPRRLPSGRRAGQRGPPLKAPADRGNPGGDRRRRTRLLHIIPCRRSRQHVILPHAPRRSAGERLAKTDRPARNGPDGRAQCRSRVSGPDTRATTASTYAGRQHDTAAYNTACRRDESVNAGDRPQNKLAVRRIG